MHNNLITSIDANAFDELDVLEVLSIDYNNITRLPNLQFHISSNLITTILESAFNLTVKLQTINLSLNNLTTLPPAIFTRLTCLQKISLRFNQIEYLPVNIFFGLFKKLNTLICLSIT